MIFLSFERSRSRYNLFLLHQVFLLVVGQFISINAQKKKIDLDTIYTIFVPYYIKKIPRERRVSIELV